MARMAMLLGHLGHQKTMTQMTQSMHGHAIKNHDPNDPNDPMAAGWFALVHAAPAAACGHGGWWLVAAAGMAGMACSMRLGAPGRAGGKGPAKT